MWYKNKVFQLLFFLAILVIVSCSKKEIEYKGETLLGYWQVEEVLSSTVNGEPAPGDLTRTFYTRFEWDQSGSLYDRDRRWSNDIKWALQEDSEKDILFISVALTSDGESSEFSLNVLSEVDYFEEDEFRTIEQKVEYEDGDEITKINTKTYTRRR